MPSSRRQFLATLPLAVGTGLIRPNGWPAASPQRPLKAPTIQDVLDLILAQIPGSRSANTVDTVKSGDPSQAVTGVVSTFLATGAVIQAAIDRGANLIITHEPTYYNHWDRTDWLADDPVYQAKAELLAVHNIVVWRFHDYWHQHRPDGILHGFLQRMQWTTYQEVDHPICAIPSTPLDTLVATFKERLGIDTVRVMGAPNLPCRRIGLLLGAMGGRAHIEFLSRESVDLLVCGEAQEWETTEYVRDATFFGRTLGLAVLGHANTEEPGMAWLVDWLQPLLPDVPVTHVPTTDPFRYV